MTTTAQTRPNAPGPEIQVSHTASGQDGGRLWKYYEATADAFDNGMTRLVSCSLPLAISFRKLTVAASSKNREASSVNPIAQTYIGVPSFEVPDPPEELGQDGGKFYRAYDAIAEEVDNDMTQSLKEQLDGMLIFAGLFAGVNSAFLALTLPLLSADPADDTNALLVHNNAILIQLVLGRNDSALQDPILPSKSFVPKPADLSVNVLFSLSLALAITSSFLAVLGRQWLVYYRKRSGGGPDRQRWEQLKRFLGAKRWGLELILDDILPSLLQAGLIIFCISFLIYLHGLNPTLSTAVGAPLYLALAFFIGGAICAIWDRFCPFRSPLSHFLWWILTAPPKAASIVLSWIYQKAKGSRFWKTISRSARRSQRRRTPAFTIASLRSMKPTIREVKRPFKWVCEVLIQPVVGFLEGRREEDNETLQAIALQRTICTTDDPASLLHAAANILAITDSDRLKTLWDDGVFRDRLLELRDNSYSAALYQGDRHMHQSDLAASVARLYWCTATHILIHVRGPDQSPSDYFYSFGVLSRVDSFLKIPADRLANSSPILIRASFVYSALLTMLSSWRPEDQRVLCNELASYCSAVKGQDWGLLSLVFWTISPPPAEDTSRTFSRNALESLRKAYMGGVDITLDNLDSALVAVSNRRGQPKIDHHGLITTIFLCVEHIIASGRGGGGLGLEGLLRMLTRCEVALRTAMPQNESTEIIRKIRVDTQKAIKGLLPDLKVEWYSESTAVTRVNTNLAKD
ncbi:hypothetical protein FRC01_008455 [Tulasnella sp. 417]|nr:hypothetical protein FRC01_008455 [Tulasnella sp. 417]